MESQKIKNLEDIAISAFKLNAELSRFFSGHAGEFSLGIVEQKEYEPFRIDLYWNGPELNEEQLKRLSSTENKNVERIAFCEIDKKTSEVFVKEVSLPKV